MNRRRWTRVFVLACCLALAAPAAGQERLALAGRVVMETPGQAPRPASRLTVRLYFPKETRRPTLVTYTDSNGNFRYNDLPAGRYLLEVYQGKAMTYQRALTLDRNLPQPLAITLKPR